MLNPNTVALDERPKVELDTGRVQRLKARLFEMDDRVIFLERMEIIKQCAHKYEDCTAGIKFGRTLDELLTRTSIVIEEDDLIVGRVPEVLPTEDQERWFEANRKDYSRVSWFWTTGHLTIAWERLLNEGLRGIKERARAHLETISGKNGASLSKRDFLQGTILCCDAIAAYALRYAREAKALARSAASKERELALLAISGICERVPSSPARTFHEAIQAVWLVDMILHVIVGARDFALGRLDQYLYPFYQRDLAASRITPRKAQELVECLYIKCNEIIGLADQDNARKRSLCQDSVQYAVLGGQTPDGQDAVNPLSLICLQAGYLKLKQPAITIRYHEEIDESFWREACALARAGGSVGIYNDAVEIPAFTSVGVDLRDARDYVHYGCCNANVPGKEGSLMERCHNLPKYLELAMNDGLDPLTGQQAGPKTGEAGRFTSIDDLLHALKLQIRHELEAERAKYPPLSPQAHARCSFTLESIFLEDCIENGREWRLGGTKYWHKSQHGVGIATIADSLAAIQEMVFESRDLTLAEFSDVLNADYRGFEPLRQRALNRCPKYGNDDGCADAIAVEVAHVFCDEVVRCNVAPHSVRFWPEIYSYHNNRRLGAQLGATPDGRMRGQPISENQSPSYGRDIEGVTACLNSIAKLPFHRTPGGGTNLKLHPSAVQGQDGLDALSSLLKTYFGQGGQHLQFNIVNSSMLEDAQRRPDEYRTLSVRVVGYSAYFVTLSKEVQDDLIRRTEYST